MAGAIRIYGYFDTDGKGFVCRRKLRGILSVDKGMGENEEWFAVYFN